MIQNHTLLSFQVVAYRYMHFTLFHFSLTLFPHIAENVSFYLVHAFDYVDINFLYIYKYLLFNTDNSDNAFRYVLFISILYSIR